MWKSIDNFEGYYEVSDEGAVRSLDRVVKELVGGQAGKNRSLKGSDMKLTKSRSSRGGYGYYVVNLHRDGVSFVVPVHILVAKAFIPNPLNLPTVNHIDGDKYNNRVSNLEWASYSENNVHALRIGLRSPRGVKIGQFSQDGELIAVYRSVSEASRMTGVSRGMLSHCVNGRSKSASGFLWKKLPEGQTTIPKGSTREDELPAEAQRPR